MVEKKDEVFMEITNNDIYTLLKDTHEQALKTNGRVNKLEKKSIGLWVSNHPFKFALGVLIFTSIVISDIRHPMLELISKIWN